ncbi:MAG: 3-phosphoshikimate 1-carboxyvinyltransferase [Clostridia bacterium]|nr:3-phosphoshikimate 1-carboxyvinyltransferase [Clostridia bacterium]
MNYSVKNIYGKTNNNKVTVSVPGSKSITARALLLAALAEGTSTLYGAQFSDDCQTFIECLKALKISVEVDGTTVKVTGCGGRLSIKEASLNVGSAGTAARFLPAFLAFQKGKFTLNCSEQMKSRPQAPLINALKSVGAKFTFLEKENSYPFIIEGTDSPETYAEVDVTKSSQYLSAVLMSAVCAKKPFTVKPVGSHGNDYINMTLDMMWSFGVTVEDKDGKYIVDGGYLPKKYDIEPDVSAACYFYAINKILGTNIEVRGIMPHSMQGDIKFINLLKNFNGGKVDMGSFSDQALTLAAIAPYLESPTEICNVAHIRRQECDRINAMAVNLKAMNVKCEEREDGIKIYPSAPKPAHINTFGDHRVAMSFALTGLRSDGIVIENAEVCKKTFKNYFTVLDGVVKDITAK